MNRILPLRGTVLLNSPTDNRGTAYTDAERAALGLHGLLPPEIETLDEQAERAYEAYRRKADDLERHIYLRALQDTNEVLFYRLLRDHIEEMTPMVYTPVVALGCQQFSHIYRRPRGLFISYPLRDRIPELLRNRPNANVDIVVVTDGERILGIGDQGVGGLGIPIGKLSLYTLMGGIHPARTLPIVLDVGTNNADLLNDPYYLGWRHRRIEGDAYYAFVDQFVDAMQQELPRVCLQWEDFATPHARPLLKRYRDRMLTFNDDIQGTAAVALGAILSAVRLTGSRLRDQRFVFLGAGSAGIGVADFVRAALREEGLSDADALARFWVVDKDGLLHKGRNDLSSEQLPYARDGYATFAEVIDRVGATVLVGLSTATGAFSREIVQRMAAQVDRPVILPLSNPTARAEATPADLLAWTNGKAIVATGSPFAPVVYDGREIPVSQCNNMYVFPAIGLAVIGSKARRVTDGMMLAAARALASHSPGVPLLPRFRDLRRIVFEIAMEVALEAQRAGVAPECDAATLRAQIQACVWEPAYATA